MTSRSRKVAVAVGVAVLLIGVFFLGRGTAPELDRRHYFADTDPDMNSSSGPERILHGVPVGYAQTQDGAVAAASNFSRVMAAASSGETTQDVIEIIAAPDWIGEAIELAENGRAFFRDRYGPDGTLSFIPARYRVDAFSPTKATVAIWGVTLGLSPTAAGIEESWVTGTVQLEWIVDDWRVSGQSSEPGPTPEMLRTGESEGDAGLTGFEEFEGAPGP